MFKNEFKRNPLKRTDLKKKKRFPVASGRR